MINVMFRFWDKQLHDMQYQYLHDLCEDDYWFDSETSVWYVLHDSHTKQERFICMQFTGLRDNKRTAEFPEGQKIYEGDICINHNVLSDYYYVVKWIFAGFQLVTYKKPTSDVRGISHGINQGYMEDADHIEVIGNIHQNPGLLGGTK